MKRLLVVALLALLTPSTAGADEPITARGAWEGRVDYFVTGAALAVDTDGDFRVDTSAQPAPIVVGASDAPGTLEAAWLTWGGSQAEPAAGACTSGSDDTVTLGLPGGATPTVTADECFCSEGGGATYDVWICRADVTQAVVAGGGQIVGTFTVAGYDGLFMNGATHNASASLLLVYGDDALPPRRVAAFDGNLNLFNTEQIISLTGIEVASIPSGELAFYVLEGDINGGGLEQVMVQSLPGGTPVVLGDAINPVNNPFNQTINTTTPPQSGLVGVDIDRFDVSSALAEMDTQVDVTISAGNDRVWLAGVVLGVDLFDPAFRRNSTKSVALFVDQNADGFANPGDTLRYTIRLENDGNEAGTVDVRDPIPAEFLSYSVVDAAGGTDVSNANEVRIDGITVAAGASRSVIIDMVVDTVPDGVVVINTATWSAPLQGGLDGQVSSVATEIHAPIVVDPDVGMGGDDMGMGDDIGTSGDDVNITQMDMAGMPDIGSPAGPDGGTGADGGGGFDVGPGGNGSGSDSGGTGGQTSKELSDSGCCATASRSPTSGAWLLAVILVGAVRRRRVMC